MLFSIKFGTAKAGDKPTFKLSDKVRSLTRIAPWLSVAKQYYGIFIGQAQVALLNQGCYGKVVADVVVDRGLLSINLSLTPVSVRSDEFVKQRVKE